MEKCKLCGSDTEKFPKSHIIPDFMYKHLKNEKSQILRTRMPEGRKLKPALTGFYDLKLACPECEEKMSKWEGYAEKALYGSSNIQMPKAVKLDGLQQQIFNIDYTKFKLFLLSIIWKASVTTHEFFREISLGDKHQAIFAKMLTDENPGEEDKYPVWMIFTKGDPTKNLAIGQPYRIKTPDNASRYVFPIGPAIYIFHISSHGIDEQMKLNAIKKDNTMQTTFWPISRAQAMVLLYQAKTPLSPI